MNCKKCGAPLRENALFCSKCGTKVENEEINIQENAEIEEKNENLDSNKQEEIYARVKESMEIANSLCNGNDYTTYEKAVNSLTECQNELQNLGDYKDSIDLLEECKNKIEEAQKNAELYKTEKEDKDVEVKSAKLPPVFHSKNQQENSDANEKTMVVRKAKQPKQPKQPKVHTISSNKSDTKKKKKIYGAIAAGIAFVVVVAIVVTTVILPFVRYKSAIKMYEEQKYEEAFEKFKDMGDYKDAKDYYNNSAYEQAVIEFNNGNYEKCIPLFNVVRFNDKAMDYLMQAEMACLKNASIGDVVYFGADSQDTSISYQWKVIANEDGDLLLLMDDILKTGTFDEEASGTTWEECSLRNDLNNDFLDSFSDQEQKQILPVNNDNVNDYSKNKVTTTKDSIFVLSRDEVEKYLKTEEERASDNAWWCRSPLAYCKDTEGNDKGLNAPFVSEDGSIDNSHYYDMNTEIGIRPAMWVNISDTDKTKHRTEAEVKEDKAKEEKEKEEKAKAEKEKAAKEKEHTFDGTTYQIGTYKITHPKGVMVRTSPSTSASTKSIPSDSAYVISSTNQYCIAEGKVNIVEITDDGTNVWGKTDFDGWMCIYYDEVGTLMSKS